ncbi:MULTISPECIES: hypothetical protein [Pseudoalteromonas]|uniref:hypothetical protein n=1 Tax=Pseudoalteromonas TaxID=53246 RepID=UPI000C2D482C|nr:MULTISPECIES: hypothetical protein [Pseudoalteromonas]TMS80152.1 hypothetical protein CWB65_16580 [Pseudoalteromonas sp. S554]
MNYMEILKITAKSSPIPTIITIIVAITFSKVLDKEISDLVTIVALILTFLIILALIVYSKLPAKKTSNATAKEFSKNKLSDIELEDGEVFIGSKDSKDVVTSFKENEISGIKSKNGDVFIGSKGK